MLEALGLPDLPCFPTPATRAYRDLGGWSASPCPLPRCGAFRNDGKPCRHRVEPGKKRCKFHGGCSTGPKTAEGRARIADAPLLPELLDQIPLEQEIATVTADGAFDTRKCHDAIAARGAAAIIPPRKNAKPCRPDTLGAIARNEILRTSKRVGRTIWRRWSGYHRRSRAETKMHCVKLLGQRLSARDFDRQVAEFQVRVAVLNSFTALGTPITDVAG